MMEKIAEIALTIMNGLIAIGLICGMGIAVTIMSIIDGTLFGVFLGIIMIATGIFVFCMAQHDYVYEWRDAVEEES